MGAKVTAFIGESGDTVLDSVDTDGLDRIGPTAETGRYISSVNTVNNIIIIKGADIIILDFFPVKVVIYSI